MNTAHIIPNYGRYGINGYVCTAVGFDNFFARTIKIANNWCKSHGLEGVRL